MRRSVWGLAGLLALGSLANAQTLIVGPNVNISQRSGNEAEMGIAIDRLNPNRICVVSNGMFAWTTTNGGTSWSFRTFPDIGLPGGLGDPWMGSDSFGNMFLSYLSTSPIRTVVAVSTNGGASFTQVGGNLGTSSVDHPELAVGPGPIAGQQSVWVTFNQSTVVATGAVITGLGTVGSFGTLQTLANSSGGNFGDIAIGPGGRVFATFMTPSGGTGPADLRRHFDADGTGAGGFSERTPGNLLTTNVGGFLPIPAQPTRTIDAQVKLAYDNTGGPRNGRLYMLYTDRPTTVSGDSDTNIVIRSSNDDGITWSAPVRINDDVTTRSQFFGRLAIDPTTGFLAAVWLDARNSPTNTLVELWGSVSTDGGSTWLPNVKISQGQWDGRNANVASTFEMGDYIALDYFDNRFVVSWPDASNSTGNNPNGTTRLDLYFAGVLVAVPEPTTFGLLGLVAAGYGLQRRLRRPRLRRS